MATKYPPLPQPVIKSVPSNIFADKQGKTVSQSEIDRLLGYGDDEDEDTENGRAANCLVPRGSQARHKSGNYCTSPAEAQPTHGRWLYFRSG